jgi:monoterpene epsilon-lactone hydrolase
MAFSGPPVPATRTAAMRIEFFFDCSSPWTYLAFENIQPLAAEFHAEIVWRPILVGGIFNAVNPGVEYKKRLATDPPRKMAYFLKDLGDWTRAAGLEIKFPPPGHPVNSVRAMRACLVLQEQGKLIPWARAAFRAYFGEGRDISSDAVLATLCDTVDVRPDWLLMRIAEQPVKDALRANVEEAIARGAFGSPTIFLDGDDMYFGVDRLQMLRKALERTALAADSTQTVAYQRSSVVPDPDLRPTLHVPARDIPIPAHLSPEAQAQMAQGTLSNPPWPPLEDIIAWRRLIATMDEMGLAGLTMMSQQVQAEAQEIDADGVRVFVVQPRVVADDNGAVYLDIHGGALLWGSGPSCRAMGIITAGMMGSKVWAVDYRMPPDHPYPAALEDCVKAYRALLRQCPPEKIIIGGASAGGNLAAATILRARDEGLPLPAAAVLMTPEIDLTESGDTFQTLLGVDTALTSSLMPANLLYAAGHDLAHPYLSPLFGDFTNGFPPTFLLSGTRDLLLSNTVRMHQALRAAGVVAELYISEAATHVNFMTGPESKDRNRELRRFVDAYWKRGTPHQQSESPDKFVEIRQ